jgi:flagellar motor switch/type III secretory pathway protein FliN
VNARPFPLASLERLTRAEVEAGAKLRRVLRTTVRVDAFAAALAEVVALPVSVVDRGVRRADPTKSAESSVAILVATAEGGATGLVEVEAALAAKIAAAAIGRPAPRITDTARPAPAELCGAAAAIFLTASRRAHAGRALRIVAAGPAARLARDFAAANGDATTAWLTIVVGEDAFDARVTVAASAVPAADASVDVLASLGEAPIALPLVVATCLSTRAELRALVVGDAFLVPKGTLREAGGLLVGAAALVPARAERGLGADLAEGGRLVLRGRVESFPWERAITDDTVTKTLEVLEDAPVVVRVELGAVEMKAGEWAALGPGDVIALGRRVGDPAVLRVSGVEVARGELVQVEGDFGVRIVGKGSR